MLGGWNQSILVLQNNMNAISIITFRVGNQHLALPIDKVREIIRNTPLVQAPNWTGLLHGIINIRGSVIPVLDMRLVLGEKAEQTRKSRIIIVEMLDRAAGIVVDNVDDIVPLTSEQLIPLSSISWDKKAAVLAGVAKIEEQMYLVIDIDRLIREEEQKLFRELCLNLGTKEPEIAVTR